jgi:hypothetical protein
LLRDRPGGSGPIVRVLNKVKELFRQIISRFFVLYLRLI